MKGFANITDYFVKRNTASITHNTASIARCINYIENGTHFVACYFVS